jgi:hypothetical protein
MIFLTESELQELTGYVKPAAQARWLKRNGIRFFRQRMTGCIKVPCAALTGTGDATNAVEDGPRLDWIHRARQAA